MEKYYKFELVKEEGYTQELYTKIESWMAQAPIGIKTLTITNESKTIEAVPRYVFFVFNI